jgi:Protein of unknown function (DUF3987)
MSADDFTRRVEQIAAAIGLKANQLPTSWPDLRPLTADLPPAPEFNAEVLLPELLRAFVLDTADRMPCPPDFVAAPLLVALGSVVGARCGIKPKRRDDWVVPANLWGGVIGDPSSKKTPSISQVMRFMDGLEVAASEQSQLLMKGYEVELAAYEAHRTSIEQEMKMAAKGKGTGRTMGDLKAALEGLEEPEKPQVRRYRSNDATTAMLAELLSVNPSGLLVFRDEITGLLASWDKQGNEGDRAFYLEAWNGTSPYRQDRVGRGEVWIPNHCLSLFGGIQPEMLARYLIGLSSSLDNDGRVQRFQVLVYPESVPWQWRDRYPSPGIREQLRDLFHHLAVFDPEEAGAEPATEFTKRPTFHFDDTAQEIYVRWCTDLNTQRLPKEPTPLMRQHLAKYERLFCSIALILHLTQVRPGPAVSAETAMRAAAWTTYLEGHARRVYGLLELQQVSAASALARRLSQGKLIDGFTVRDVQRKCWAGMTQVSVIEQALGVLEEHSYVAGVDQQNPSGGPQTVRYFINPKIRDGA